MSYTVKNLPKSVVELSFTVAPEEIGLQLAHAAEQLTKERPLSGFRPGKAPYEVIVARYGEMAIYEAALPEIVRKAYVQAVTETKLRTFGEPQISVGKLAPGNPITFTAEVVCIPKVTVFPDAAKTSITIKTPKVDAAEVEKSIDELSRMQTREVKVDRAAAGNDKLMVDLRLNQDGVAVEGGTALNHGVYLGEDYYIPGFREQVTGLKAGDNKKFKLPFPADYHQKNLADKEVEFDVTVKEVYELTPPARDDVFAKSLGQESMEKLRELIAQNMKAEAEDKEKQRQEIELLTNLVKEATFEEIPDLLVNNEVDRMVAELANGIKDRGMEFVDYLASIKKSVNDVKLEMTPKAVERIKVAILLRDIGERDGVEVSDADVLEETTRRINAASSDPAMQKALREDEHQDYIRSTLLNRKIIASLLEKAKKVTA